jgi:hypothetical protein
LQLLALLLLCCRKKQQVHLLLQLPVLALLL